MAANPKIAVPDVPGMVRALVLNCSQWLHLRTGGEYTMLLGGMAKSDVREGDAVVVYVNKVGQVCVRAHEEFHDGRFRRTDVD